MTAPTTIKPTRTTTPNAVPALVDAEVLAGHLVYILSEIKQHGHLEGHAFFRLLAALDSATDAQHRITSLQMMEGR